MKEAYIELFGIMGEQMAEAIEKCTGTAVDARLEVVSRYAESGACGA